MCFKMILIRGFCVSKWSLSSVFQNEPYPVFQNDPGPVTCCAWSSWLQPLSGGLGHPRLRLRSAPQTARLLSTSPTLAAGVGTVICVAKKSTLTTTFTMHDLVSETLWTGFPSLWKGQLSTWESSTAVWLPGVLHFVMSILSDSVD